MKYILRVLQREETNLPSAMVTERQIYEREFDELFNLKKFIVMVENLPRKKRRIKI